MLSANSKFVLDMLFCVFGIVSGLSGGVSFSAMFFHNKPAMMWAYYSGCIAFACLVIELLRHHSLLQVCCTPFSLWFVILYAVLSLATTTSLFLVHVSVAIRNRESVAGKSALDHSDFIVAVWTFMSFKFCLKLFFVSKKARHELLERSVARAESPDFQAMHRQGPYSESLDSHITGRRRLRRGPDDNRRSSSDTRRARRYNDRVDLLSDASPMPTPSQLATASDSESAGDMDEAAHRLTLDL